MKRIRITDKYIGGDERVIFNEKFEKVMFVTEEDFGMVGLRNFDEIMMFVDAMLDNVAITLTKLGEVPEEELSARMAEDMAFVKTIACFNVAMMTLGPIADIALRDDSDEETRERYREMLAITKEVKALSFRVAALSDSINLSDWKRDEDVSEEKEGPKD